MSKIKLLLQFIGYLCSNYLAKAILCIIGEPHTAKSLICNFIGTIIGEGVSKVPLHKLTERFAGSALANTRVNIDAEMRVTKLKNLEYVKAISGGDHIQIEGKYANIYSKRSRIKILVSGNAMPPVDSSESTSAFTDRLKVLYIRKSIPRSEWILDLEEKFLEERDIIFSLAVKELRELVENKFEFIIPADTTTFMVDYNSHLNTIGQFVSDRCELGSANKEHKRDLLACYKEYAKANAFTSIATDDIFFDAITKIEGVKKSKIWNNGCSLAGYWGIKLKSNCFDIPPEEDVNESS